MSKELYTKRASGEVCRLAKTFADLHIQQNGRVFYFSSPASKPVTNAAQPDLQTLNKIAQLLNVSIHDLIKQQ